MTFRIPIKKIILAGLFQIAGAALTAQVTLEECVGMAQENYPLVRKYNLLQQTEEIELSDINKGWLPQIGVYGVYSRRRNQPDNMGRRRIQIPTGSLPNNRRSAESIPGRGTLLGPGTD